MRLPFTTIDVYAGLNQTSEWFYWMNLWYDGPVTAIGAGPFAFSIHW